MKILYLSVMLFCAILVFFIPGISVEESITVSTDRTSYQYGENYTISGKVSPVVPNEAVSILILSTNYRHPESLSVLPNSEGRYLHTLSLPIKDVSDGNFTIIAQYAGAKNQTAFNYTGLPCYQQNMPAYFYPAPIIRVPGNNPRILDSLGNAITGHVKVGQQIQITYPLENGLNCNQPFAYIVQIQDLNGKTVSLSWITGTLLAGQSLNPAQSWTPRHNDTYIAQIFTWQSIDNPNALAAPAIISFDGFYTRDGFVQPPVGTYTIVAGDMWGHLAMQHFTVENSKIDYCETPYPDGSGIPVLYMPANSTGKLCVRYSNPNEPFQAGFDILEAQNYGKKAGGTTISSLPDMVTQGNSTVVYTINSGPKAGFFRMLISCPGMQIAIGYDNNSNFVQSDFPWLAQSFYCGIGHNFHITGTSEIGVKYIPYN